MILMVVSSLVPPGLSGAEREAAARTSVQDSDLFSSDTIPHVDVEIPEEGLETLREHTGRRADTPYREDVLATVREGGRTYSKVSVHLKGSGGSFRRVDSNPGLTLSFDKQVAGQRFHGLQKISLNNSVQDSTFLCERVGRRIFDAAGVPVPRSSYATVSLNGRALGLYVLVEGWNKQFLKRHFQDGGGNLYEASLGMDIADSLEVKSGDSPDDRSMLAALLRAIREAELTNRCAAIARVLDLDRFLTFMALEVMLGHWDGYCLHENNYRIFHDRSAGRLVFLPHGMDQLFGMRRPEMDPPIAPQMSGMVASAIMETEEGRQRYLDRLTDLHARVFDLNAITNDLRQTAARLRPFLAEDSSALGTFDNRVPMLERRIVQRHANLNAQLVEARTPLKFQSVHVFNVSGWSSRRDSGRPNFSRQDRNGVDGLQITANSPADAGTWRRSVLLEPGRYRFEGRARIENTSRWNLLLSPTVSMRSSEAGQPRRTDRGGGAVAFAHDFAVESQRRVEFICEIKGGPGRVIFESGSLKVHRLSGAKATETPAGN
jgi:spore coat protein H